MKYIANHNFLTASGKRVCRLGQGTWHLADNEERRASEIAALRAGIDLGLNLIDTAERYGDGASEQLVRETVAPYKREDLFIVSKVAPWNAGRDKIFDRCQASLERLGIDYLDSYLLHWRTDVPLEETAECMDEMVQRGWLRHWGVSNLDTSDMRELYNVKHGEDCIVDQVVYNLGERESEFELLPWLADHRMAVMAYCPLAQFGAVCEGLPQNRAVNAIAEAKGATVAQVLLAFLLKNPNVIPIPKSSSPEHTAENAKAMDLELTDEDIAALSEEYPAPTKRMKLGFI